MRKTFFAALCLLILAGCYGPVDIAYHEPAHYVGPDPLLAKERSPEQQQLLLERFNQGQTDR